jgi:GNAT superfamily N-acetyltransferase
MQPGSSAELWAHALRESISSHDVPAVFVALEKDVPVGSVAVVGNDMDTHPDIGPWLAALYVAPARRGSGLATALARHAIEFARGLRVPSLYTYLLNPRHAALCSRGGWREIGREVYKGSDVVVMALDLGA